MCTVVFCGFPPPFPEEIKGRRKIQFPQFQSFRCICLPKKCVAHILLDLQLRKTSISLFLVLLYLNITMSCWDELQNLWIEYYERANFHTKAESCSSCFKTLDLAPSPLLVQSRLVRTSPSAELNFPSMRSWRQLVSTFHSTFNFSLNDINWYLNGINWYKSPVWNLPLNWVNPICPGLLEHIQKGLTFPSKGPTGASK